MTVARPDNADISITLLSSDADTAARPSVLAAVPLLRISALDSVNFVSKFLFGAENGAVDSFRVVVKVTSLLSIAQEVYDMNAQVTYDLPLTAAMAVSARLAMVTENGNVAATPLGNSTLSASVNAVTSTSESQKEFDYESIRKQRIIDSNMINIISSSQKKKK